VFNFIGTSLFVIAFFYTIFPLLLYTNNRIKKEFLVYYSLSPYFIFFSTWSLTFFLYSIGQDFLSFKTTIIILIFLFFSFLGFFLSIAKKFSKHNISILQISSTRNNLSIPKLLSNQSRIEKVSFILILFQVLSIYAMWIYITSATKGGGLYLTYLLNGNLGELRRILAIGEYTVPLHAKIMMQFKYFNSFNIVFFTYLTFVFRYKKYKFFLFISILLSIIFGIEHLARDQAVWFLFLYIITYHVLYNKTLLSKNFFIIVLLSLAISVFVVQYRTSLDNKLNVFNQVRLYISGGLSGLEAFVNGYPHSDSITLEIKQKNYITQNGFDFLNDIELGKNIFKQIYSYICIFIKNCYVYHHHEYIFYPISTNIYTGLRNFIQDFGYAGISIFAFIFGFLFMELYNYLFFKMEFNLFFYFLIAKIDWLMFKFFGGFTLPIKDILIVFFIVTLMNKILKFNRKKSRIRNKFYGE